MVCITISKRVETMEVNPGAISLHNAIFLGFHYPVN